MSDIPVNTRPARRRVAKSFDPSKGRTKSEFAAECDVNNVLNRFRKTGQLTHVSSVRPVYGDFSNVDDYMTALEKVRSAQLAFESLPAPVRAACENDPVKFLEFALNPANAEKLKELGLLEPEVPASLTAEAIGAAVAAALAPAEGEGATT